ncbi:MAG: ABC transporter permease [Legionella sp.]
MLPVDVVVHSKYNPDRVTQYNIVPGLLSAVLSLTLVLVTALSVVREREGGTIDILLTTPVRPMEIVFGKLVPYIIVAYIQSLIILALAYFVFKIPIHGSLTLLLACCFTFIIANLALGITFSTVADNQIQAAQATSFYFIPSLLFSGFMFPFG